ncbi:cytochrome c [Nitrosospira sp. Nsp5]|uniref:Cytochrome c n=1 Tax=Nitrosospira multiformis TaxID=1231 RepID=A0ABY0TGR9_9PROT|nr:MULTISPECIES: cytochrome c [Nitrosospira]PTR10576.1 cytochrome c [Nitrosospira sp. Nsp5]SDQ80510.1 Cytochrome c [Nitrosospira multiformis]
MLSLAPKILRHSLLCGLLASALSLAPAFAQNPITFEFKGVDQAVKTLSLKDLGAITPAVSLKVFEVHENAERIYRAFPARPVLDKIFGKEWEKAQEIVFTSIDGYQPSIPIAKFLAYDAYFAFAHENGAPFTMTNTLQNNEIVPLGPLYLIWDNINSKVLLESGASDMPYQIKSVEIKFVAPFPNIAPPANASAEVQRGFAHFRKYCMACHTINGEGGGKAPELNYPVSVVEYIKPEYLKRWIENPQTIRYNTTMPGLAKEIPDRGKITEELILYLKVMSITKRAPMKPSDQGELDRHPRP